MLLAVVGYLMIVWFWACVSISAMYIYDDLAFQKVFLLLFIFAERCEVPCVCCFPFTQFEIFLTLVPWFLLNFIGVDSLGMDGWYL